MALDIEKASRELLSAPRRWLITGVAGFIGSHLLEALLNLGQEVAGVDNFATGRKENLEDVKKSVGAEPFSRFEFVEGDILDFDLCRRGCEKAQIVLHQAALGSVPRSIEDPRGTTRVNVEGFVNIALACREQKVPRLVYASSSSVYGDNPELPKREQHLGRPLSPYAASKRSVEMLARVFGDVYGVEIIGLRYFNVFGPRQDPGGPYAAVIPRWIEARLAGRACRLYGDGSTSRDFCYVTNVVQANLLAALAERTAIGREYNIAVGERTTLLDLHRLIDDLCPKPPPAQGLSHEPSRPGDVPHSLADISSARKFLGYEPAVAVKAGLAETVEWYKRRGH